MKKFTKLWQLMMVLLLTSSVAFGQNAYTARDAQNQKMTKEGITQQKQASQKLNKQKLFEQQKAEAAMKGVEFTQEESYFDESMYLNYQNYGQAPSNLMIQPKKVDIITEGSTAWGFGFFGTGFMNWDVDIPGTTNSINGAATYTPYCGDFSNESSNNMYILDNNDMMIKRIDVATGQVAKVVGPANIGTDFGAGMACDRTTGTMYLMGLGATDNLYTVDLQTGNATLVGSTPALINIIEIAVDNSGQMYGWGLDDNAYSIDKATGAATLIGPLGFDANYAQGGNTDPATGTIYLAAYNNTTSSGEERTLDVATGATTLVGAFAGGEEVASMAFPSLAPTITHDVMVSSVDNPVSGGNTAAEVVTITVYNGGSVAESNIPVSYVYDGGPAVNETIAGPLAAGDYAVYSFTVTVDASASGNHTVLACTNLVGDEITANDCENYTFNTFVCTVVNTYPYAETFDNNVVAGQTGGCTPDGSNPLYLFDCWINDAPAVPEDIDWNTQNGATGSSGTGPSDDITGGGIYLYTETSGGCNSAVGTVISPEFDFTPLTAPNMSFWYHMYGAAMGTMSVDISVDGGTVWTNLWTLTGDQGNAWNQVVVDLSAYTAETSVLLRWQSLTGSSYTSDMAFDQVEVYEAPTCAAPDMFSVTAVGATTADLQWDEAGTSIKWNIAWGTPGFDPDVNPLGTDFKSDPFGANPRSYQITGLTAYTDYEAYVQSECGPGDLSAWTGPVAFSTLYNFASYTLPFLEDFETGLGQTDNELGNTLDWTIDNVLQVSGLQSAHNGPYTTNNSNILFVTGTFDLSAYGPAQLTFNNMALSEGGWDHCYVEISTDGGLTYDALPIAAYMGSGIYAIPSSNNPPVPIPCFDEDSYPEWTGATPDNTWWKLEAFDLTPYNAFTAVTFRFRFVSDGSVQRDGWHLDDVVVEEIPPCLPPTGLAAANITQTTADLTWSSNSGLSNIEWGLAGFAQGTGTMVNSVASPYPLTGLTDATAYDFYVMDDCGGSGTSTWVGPSTFTTLYYPPANDDCINAQAVVGPYPQTVSGTTNGATIDCAGVLDWDAVWYTIDLPYAQNFVSINLCLADVAATLNNTGIILTQDCSCDPNGFIYSDGTYSVTGNCISSLNFNVAGPATVYYPVYTVPNGDFSFDVDVTERFQLAGTLTYANGAMNPMELTTVMYDDGTNTGSTMTDLFGNYQFDYLPAATYTVTGEELGKVRGGTDVGDINVVVDHILGTPLTGLAFDAADVDLSLLVDVTDLNEMIDDILGNPGWAAADWLFESPSFILGPSNTAADFQSLCSGDPDGSYTPPPAPAGAVCANAIPMAFDGSGPVSMLSQTNCGLGDFYNNTALGSYDGGEDIIYELTVTGTWTVNIILDPKGTTYTGLLIADACPDVGTSLGTSTSSGGTAHMIGGLTLTAGTYYIMVDTWPSPTCIPDFDLTIEEYVVVPPPANDLFCTPTAIVVDDPPIAGDNTLATGEGWEPTGSCWFGSADNTMWYSFVAPASGNVQVNTDFVTGTNDTQITLYDWTAGLCDNPTLLELGCGQDDGVTGNGWMAIIDATGLTPGATYYVQVDVYSSGVGDFMIEVTAQ